MSEEYEQDAELLAVMPKGRGKRPRLVRIGLLRRNSAGNYVGAITTEPLDWKDNLADRRVLIRLTRAPRAKKTRNNK
jgi:hypothetical protein